MSTVTVVIPTLNEELHIGTLLRALRQQTHPVEEILVVDGGSSDATVHLASRFPKVRVLAGHPPVGAQRQLGLENAHSETVVFLDADTMPPPDFIGRCLGEMDARRLDAACPWYRPHPSSPPIAAVYLFFNLVFIAVQKVLASGAGSCILARRAFALSVGGFRSDLVYEDIEFVRRCSRRGRFGMIRPGILVSDRRFREFGVARMLLKYLSLSLFFSLGLFKLAGLVSYPFGKYRRSNDELVVLVNENDEPVGTACKRTLHGPDTPLHRAFSLFVLNRSGELLLQQRSSSKPTWPLEWSNSCCGHPGPGESTEDAARRRAVEELGLTLLLLYNVLPNYRYRAQKDGVTENEICPVLVGLASGQAVPNPSEVHAVKWVRWEDFVESLAQPDAYTPWCREEAALLDASPEFHSILAETRSSES